MKNTHAHAFGNKALAVVAWLAVGVGGVQARENLAPSAEISGSGRNHRLLVDGVKGDPARGEWVADSPNTWYGWIKFPKVEFRWKEPQMVNQVVIYDRASEAEHFAAGILKFGDGSEVHVTAIPNDGSAKVVTFEPRATDRITLTGVDGVGTRIGLAEMEVYFDPKAKPDARPEKQYPDFVSYVDPCIETGRGRWFFCTPGSRPFGMVSAAAYTRNKNQGGGGYNFNSNEILGFANVHGWIMSGINIMPTTGKLNYNQGEKGWKSKFSHDGEVIEPGYHKVFLDRYKTQVEYTCTDHTAIYRMKYKEAADANLLLQLGGFVGAASYVDGKAKRVGNNAIEGSHGMTDRLWGGPKLTHVYYVMMFDRPIDRMDGWKGAREKRSDISDYHNPIPRGRLNQNKRKYLFKNLPEEQAGVAMGYRVKAGDEVKVKIGISYTSIENAQKNLEAECPHWDFDRVRVDARAQWNEWLGKIAVKGGDLETRIKFYTDLWHVLLGRHNLDDVSGDYPSYMGLGHKNNTRTIAKGADGKPKHHMYNFDALWLTMWNLNILWGLGWPGVMDDFSACCLRYAQDGGHLPNGPSGGGYTGIMGGNPAASLMTATWQKGLMTKVNAETAYQAMRSTNQCRNGVDGPGRAVQAGFETWAIAQMAEEMGKDADVKEYQGKINAWQKYYSDQHKLLIQGDNPFSNHGWIEANAWQGTFGLSHALPQLAEKMGGSEVMAKQLNHAFEQSVDSDFVFTYGAGYVSYANQPGCSNAHVFNVIGHPWLSQYWVRRVSRQAYGGTNPNIGYGGHDEDQGQMGGVSALMKLGLFSVRGTSSKIPRYEITAPEFDEITITLDPRYYQGKTFTIRTHGNSPKNCYIQKATLNGKPLRKCWILHEDFAKGGTLELWLGDKPNKQWGK